MPDRTFHNFRASNLLIGHFFFNPEAPFFGFCFSKNVQESVRCESVGFLDNQSRKIKGFSYYVNPTGPSTILGPRDQEIGVFYAVNFIASKLQKKVGREICHFVPSGFALSGII